MCCLHANRLCKSLREVDDWLQGRRIKDRLIFYIPGAETLFHGDGRFCGRTGCRRGKWVVIFWNTKGLWVLILSQVIKLMGRLKQVTFNSILGYV